jgi:tRNA G18 (ribose-2'-O)-methylase SpoU
VVAGTVDAATRYLIADHAPSAIVARHGGRGPDESWRAAADVSVSHPAGRAATDSLNAATAAAILLFGRCASVACRR